MTPAEIDAARETIHAAYALDESGVQQKTDGTWRAWALRGHQLVATFADTPREALRKLGDDCARTWA